ncbi:probable salivary secreted peptide [Hylaeus anthracinus]|uniref:probable salivary secreted peptide n=1 Tax=Hylaeus anthracinus TaxID=313031 RepID=UPI0023B9A75D|nr:probable salivary secreted peptide [Hylaeus anthracinus]
MSYQKVAVYLAIVVIAVLATNVNSSYQEAYARNNTSLPHHLILGKRLPGDRLFLSQTIIKNSTWWNDVETWNFSIGRYSRITMVRALDQMINGNGANATLVRGGLGFNNVTLMFKSQKGYGINFIVELYGR